MTNDRFFNQETYAKELKKHLNDLTSSSLPPISTPISTSTSYGLLLSTSDTSLSPSTVSNSIKHLNQDQYKKELNKIIKQIQKTESAVLPLVSSTLEAKLLKTVIKKYFSNFLNYIKNIFSLKNYR
jgi:hypothetical protein